MTVAKPFPDLECLAGLQDIVSSAPFVEGDGGPIPEGLMSDAIAAGRVAAEASGDSLQTSYVQTLGDLALLQERTSGSTVMSRSSLLSLMDIIEGGSKIPELTKK